MVAVPVTAGAFVGLVVSGAFIWQEIGKYATPQVPRTLFSERRVVFSYTAGLFVGIVLVLFFLLLVASLQAGGFPGTVISLAALVAALEIAQWLLGRSVYFGSDEALPFYVLSFRAGAAGLMGTALVAQYLAGPTLEVVGLAAVILASIALVALLAASGIQSTPTGPPDARRPGAVGRSVLLELFGFLLLALGPLGGDPGVLVAALAVAGGSAGLYLSRRGEVLDRIRAPRAPEGEEPEARVAGRFDRRTP